MGRACLWTDQLHLAFGTTRKAAQGDAQGVAQGTRPSASHRARCRARYEAIGKPSRKVRGHRQAIAQGVVADSRAFTATSQQLLTGS